MKYFRVSYPSPVYETYRSFLFVFFCFCFFNITPRFTNGVRARTRPVVVAVAGVGVIIQLWPTSCRGRVRQPPGAHLLILLSLLLRSVTRKITIMIIKCIFFLFFYPVTGVASRTGPAFMCGTRKCFWAGDTTTTMRFLRRGTMILLMKRAAVTTRVWLYFILLFFFSFFSLF